MKSTPHASALAAMVLMAAAFAASAQTTTTTASVDATLQQEQTVAEATADRIAETTPEIDRFCARDTGSRIVPRDKDGKRCMTFGRVYTQDDIQRTGAVDLADALRKLDPAIR